VARAQFGQRRRLERLGDLEPWRAELACGSAQHASPRVLGAVHAMAEAHESFAAVECVLDPALGIPQILGLIEHLQHARRRAAV
jgi:hypothetical protein